MLPAALLGSDTALSATLQKLVKPDESLLWENFPPALVEGQSPGKVISEIYNEKECRYDTFGLHSANKHC